MRLEIVRLSICLACFAISFIYLLHSSCSVPCSKIHKTSHGNENDKEIVPSAPPALQQQEPAYQLTQTTLQPEFEGFENDPELKRLLSRFPHLQHELQLVYGVTIEPGPDEVHTWARQKWLDDGSAQQQSRAMRSRGGRGRGRGGFRGGYRGGHGNQADDLPFAERQHGPWTQSKGDKQGLDLLRKLQDVNHLELSEGMLEFVRLCAIRFN